jgi:hypothetical protein
MLAVWVELQGAPVLVYDTTQTDVLSYMLMKAGWVHNIYLQLWFTCPGQLVTAHHC